MVAPSRPKVWKPSHCPSRYATLLEFQLSDDEEEASVDDGPRDVAVQTDPEPLLCCGCRRPILEQFSFGCQHFFCKRCIAETRHTLVTQFQAKVEDHRSTFKCPVAECKQTIDCRPLINGDFRFFLHRENPIPEIKDPDPTDAQETDDYDNLDITIFPQRNLDCYYVH